MASRKTGVNPIEIIVEKHKADEKDIRHYCKKWSEKTSGVWKWPDVGTLDEQLCQKIKERITIWDEQKKGLKARTKLMKKEKVVEWFEGEGKERRENERIQKEWAKTAARKKEEERENELTKKIKEAIQEEKDVREGKRK